MLLKGTAADLQPPAAALPPRLQHRALTPLAPPHPIPFPPYPLRRSPAAAGKSSAAAARRSGAQLRRVAGSAMVRSRTRNASPTERARARGPAPPEFPPRPTPAAGPRGGLGAGWRLAAASPLSIRFRLSAPRGLPAGASLRRGKQPQELRNSSLEAARVGAWARGSRQSPSRGSL